MAPAFRHNSNIPIEISADAVCGEQLERSMPDIHPSKVQLRTDAT